VIALSQKLAASLLLFNCDEFFIPAVKHHLAQCRRSSERLISADWPWLRWSE
jgi:hypothetical protein